MVHLENLYSDAGYKIQDTGLTFDVFASSQFLVEIMGLCPCPRKPRTGLKKSFTNNLSLLKKA